jgi:hypothetical protein
MDAQRIRIALHDESAGYEVSPARVPLAELRSFVREADDFLRADGEAGPKALEVAIVHGSLAIETEPTAHPALLQDLLRLSNSEMIDAVHPKRRVVMERWQKLARAAPGTRFEVSAPFLPQPITVSANTDFHADDADQWVKVERYVRGEIVDMGGHKQVNAHIRLPDGKSLIVDADREFLRDEKINRLYKQAMVRITAEYNVTTRDYRNARLLQFVEHEGQPDEKAMERLKQRGAKAWADVGDAGAWIDALRGNAD